MKHIFGSRPKPKLKPTSQSSDISSTASPAEPSGDSNQWTCGVCTLHNSFSDSVCAVCNTARSNNVVGGTPTPRTQSALPKPQKQVKSSSTETSIPAVAPCLAPSVPSSKPTPSHAPSNDTVEQFVSRNDLHGSATMHTSVVLPGSGTILQSSYTGSVEDIQKRLSSTLVQTTATDAVHQESPRPNNVSKAPKFTPNGGMENTPNVYKESFANAGVAGGERTKEISGGPKAPEAAQTFPNEGLAKLSQKAQPFGQTSTNKPPRSVASVAPSYDQQVKAKENHRRVGPPQAPVREEISTQDRQRQIMRDSGGSRVNYEDTIQKDGTSSRFYELGDYEKSVYIDENRHLREPIDQPQTTKPTGTLEGTAIPYEVAAVGAKIRNMHKLGGERVKEMDHFVSTVRTPTVTLMLSEGDGKEAVGAANVNDIGAYVQRTTKANQLGLSTTVVITQLNDVEVTSSPVTLMVDPQYFTSLGSGKNELPDYILQYARIFWSQVLVEVFRNILCIELSPETVQLYYIATMRADELVCSMGKKNKDSKEEEMIFINLLAFQQSGMCDTFDDVPYTIPLEKLSDVLSYWITRVAMAIRNGHYAGAKFSNHNTGPIPTASSSQAAKPTGLYDKMVRQRFYARLSELQAQQ